MTNSNKNFHHSEIGRQRGNGVFADMDERFLEYGRSALQRVLSALPSAIKMEITAIGASRADFPAGLSEIRLRRSGASAIVLGGRNIALVSPIEEKEWYEVQMRACAGAYYAQSDSAAEGYFSMGDGIRVGVAGDGRWERGRFVFAGGCTALVFRIPSSPSENAKALFDAFMEKRCGMLIYSKPAEGKTSALRALAYMLGSAGGLRCVAVDERREIPGEIYRGLFVDILRGYSKHKGIEIALRTMSAEVVLVDEIGNAAEAESIRAVGDGGVPVIATAHSASREALCRKPGISRLIDEGYFGILARLYRSGDAFGAEIGYL